MNEEKILNGYYQADIKTSRNEDSVYAMKYASQQMLIDKLQQENQSLKDSIEKARNLLCEADSLIMKQEPLFKINIRILEAKGILKGDK